MSTKPVDGSSSQTAEITSSSSSTGEISVESSQNDSDEEALPLHWTKIASKKRPGKFYYFNAKTRQSLWENPGKTKILEQEDQIIRNIIKVSSVTGGKVPPKSKLVATEKGVKGDKEGAKVVVGSEKVLQLKKNDTQFKKRNLAKDRLDALQKRLEMERKEADLSKINGKAAKAESSRKKNEVKHVDSPLKVTSPSPKRRLKETVASKSEEDLRAKRSRESPKIISKSRVISKKVTPKRQLVTHEEIEKELPTFLPKVEKLTSFKIPKKLTQEPVSSPIFVDIRNLEETKTVHAVASKETTTADASVKSSLPSDVSTSKEVAVAEVSTLKRIYPSIAKVVPKPNAQKLLEAIDRPVIDQPPDIPLEPPKFCSTPKAQPQAVPQPSLNNLKSPANERLSQIREQLADEVKLLVSFLDEDTEMVDLSDTSVQQQQSNAVSQVEAVEDMEWEDIPEEVAIQEVVAIRRSLGLKSAGGAKPCLDTSIPEYRMHLFDRTSFQRFFFMVLDTNIFLSHLKGVEKLLAKSFVFIGQPILIVPYIVLQELDRIKHREQGKPLSVAASHSIRFLNERLKQRDPRVKGQSTIEAANPIIPIDNPDDNIVNCCLQLRQIISGYRTELMLLSNDVNLRNKALVNGVQAFSFGELMAEADRIRFSADDEPVEVGGR